MKIIFILANWVSLKGGVLSNAMLAYHLQKRGHDVLVISPEKHKPSLWRQFGSLVKGKGWISTKREGISHFDNLDVPRLVLKHSPPVTDADVPDADIVVASWWEAAEWLSGLSPSKGAKVYLIRHHEIHDYLPKERVKTTYALPLHKITISQWLANIMKAEYGDSKVSLIPNSIDPEKYHAPPRQKQAVTTVGVMYSTTYWKGCDIALKAFHLAAQQVSNLQLVAFGLEEPSSDLPLPPNTKYVRQPVQSKIKDLYAQCDAWLFASHQEGFGRPILEAMACRTPVIGTPAGAAPELLASGQGILVKPNDPEDMAKAIININNLDSEEWQTMSEKAYKTATDYSWDDAAYLAEQAFHRAIERTKNNDFSGLV